MVDGVLFTAGGDLSGFLATDPRAATRIEGVPSDPGPPDPLAPLIGVVDSGVNAAHPQLAARLVEARSFVGNDPTDQLGHGTAVAIGTLGGGHKSGLLSARVTDDRHVPDLDAVIRAIDWLGERHAKIVNMSLGFEPSAPGAERLCAAIGGWPEVLFFVAAGNLGPNVSPLPAACQNNNILVVASDEPTSGPGDVIAPRLRSAEPETR